MRRMRTGWVVGSVGLVSLVLLGRGVAQSGGVSAPGGVADSAPPPVASPADPRTPIDTVPFWINSPGSYYLTRNLTLAPGRGTHAIQINAGGIGATIDLNGFTLEGPGDQRAIIVVPNYVTVRNGVIRGWQHGVVLGDSRGATLEGLRIVDCTQNAVAGARHSIYRRCNVRNAGNFLAREGSVVESCAAVDAPLQGTGADAGGVLSRCTVRGSFVGAGTGWIVTENVTSGAMAYGISQGLHANLIRANLTTHNSNGGINASGFGHWIDGNAFLANDWRGLYADPLGRTAITRNVSLGNAEAYFLLGDHDFAPTGTANDPATGPWANLSD